jgi:hypothetical protein
MEEKKVISLQEIEVIAKGELVKIPGWKTGTFITVRLRPIDLSPELLKLRSGIPNPLKKEAQEVFEGKKTNPEELSEKLLQNPKVLEQLDVFAKLALVEPTYDEIQARIPLIFEQKLAIFDWVMGGFQDLIPFREEPKPDGGAGADSTKLRDKTK